MYYEMRTYDIYPGKLKDYVKLFEEQGYPIISQYSNLVGFWQTEIGILNRVVHIWAYESLDERTKKRTALFQNPDWHKNYLSQATSLIQKQESQILLAAPFSPIK
jgi:hypothetical protein